MLDQLFSLTGRGLLRALCQVRVVGCELDVGLIVEVPSTSIEVRLPPSWVVCADVLAEFCLGLVLLLLVSFGKGHSLNGGFHHHDAFMDFLQLVSVVITF